MKFNQKNFIRTICVQIVAFSFLFVSICRANDTNKKTGAEMSVTPHNNFNDPEEKIVVEAAKKKAKKLGYDVGKYEIHTFFHGHDCSVSFCLPKSDVCMLKVHLRSNSGKVFYVEEFKNSKWIGHK